MFKAYCDRSGQIDFCENDEIPEGRLGIVMGRKKEVMQIIEVTARHAKRPAPGQAEFLVPGVPEADSDDDALDALVNYIRWIQPRGYDRPLHFGSAVR